MSDEAALKMARRIVRDGIYGQAAQQVARALLSREAERDAVIEECAKVADDAAEHFNRESMAAEKAGKTEAMYRANAALHRAWQIAREIRDLKTAGQPSADGGKEGK